MRGDTRAAVLWVGRVPGYRCHHGYPCPQRHCPAEERSVGDRALAGQRISKQLPLARKIELSDFVLWNDGSTGFLKAQVDRIVDSLDRAKAVTPLTEP